MPAVLCIDDNARSLELRKLMLESHGYSVLTATGGRRGLTLLSKNSVEVVVLDYVMPDMNGLAVARAIRSRNCKLPIVLLTGYSKRLPSELLAAVDTCVMKGEPSGALFSALRRIAAVPKKRPKSDRVRHASKESRPHQRDILRKSA